MHRHGYVAGAGEWGFEAGRPLERTIRLHHRRPSAALRQNIDRCASRKMFPENTNRGESSAWHVVAGVYTDRGLSGLGHRILLTKKATNRYADMVRWGSNGSWWTHKIPGFGDCEPASCGWSGAREGDGDWTRRCISLLIQLT